MEKTEVTYNLSFCRSVLLNVGCYKSLFLARIISNTDEIIGDYQLRFRRKGPNRD